MKKLIVALAMLLCSCAWWDKNGKTVETLGLHGTQVACILASEFSSAPEIAVACEIDKALVPEIEKMLADPRVKTARKAVREQTHVKLRVEPMAPDSK